jgi:hypothetical protein
MDEVVRDVVSAIERRDWEHLGQVLHPYVHWTDGARKTRGRTKVLALLAADPVIDPPASYELRDGQVYRWTIARRPGTYGGARPG